MPRNNQGVYTLPAGNPVVPGTLIETTWANPTMSDIAAALTGSLPRDGSAGMTGPLILSNSNPTNPLEAASKAYVQSFMVYATGMPVGAATPFLGNTPPPGFLVCDGQAVSRTTYTELFAVIGTIYGAGDGVLTFNVPDLRNQFIRGKADDRAVGSTQAGSFAAHSHPVQDPGHTHGASASASQAAHSHGITTNAHSHGVNDPGHRHNAVVGLNVSGSGIAGGSGVLIANQTEVAGTGISIQAAGNIGGNTDAQAPAVTVTPTIAAATTNETIGSTGGAETVPQNMALIYVVKAVNDTTQVGAVTSISSSDSNMIAIDSSNSAIPVLDIQSNIAFGIPKLDAGGKIQLAQLPQGSTILLGYFDASSGQNPSQAHPTTNYSNGESYIVSVAGTILVRNPTTGVESSTMVAVGGNLLYLEGQAQPDGWYYSTPASASNAANISFLPEGTIVATNVQAAIAELDSETQTALGSINTSLSGKVNKSGDTMTGTLVSESNRTDGQWGGSQLVAKANLGSTLDFASVAFYSADASNAPMVGFNKVSEADQTLGFFLANGTKAFVIDMTEPFPNGVVQAKDGLIGGGEVLGPTADLNTIVTSGFYWVDAAATNLPAGFAWSQMVVSRVLNTGSQTIVAFDTGKIATRGWNESGNVWSPWVIHGGDAAYVNVTGDTMTGQLKGITPVAASDLTRKDYVDGVSSLATNGYQKLPGGLIIQWGKNTTAAGDVSVSFPTAFPTAALSVTVTMIANPTSSQLFSATADQITASGFAASKRYQAGATTTAATEPFNWIAVGY
jgi:microcystin-dependent protein